MSGSSRGLTLFAHVCNEALMLPYWLQHHRHLFDHGVIVDRGSTDNTVEIVRALAPDWEVVRSRNPVFDARDCDREMMALEACHDGWKIILNVTEFLLHDDLRGYLADLEQSHPDVSVLRVPMAIMVDPPALRDVPPDPEVALWRQRTHGCLTQAPWSVRYLHRERNGAYTPGRHGSHHASQRLDEQLLILRYSWSPYVIVRQRAPEIQQASAAADIEMSMGFMHLVTPEQLDANYAEWALMSYDLRDNPRYRVLHERMQRLDAPAPTWRSRSTRVACVPPEARRVHVLVSSPRADALAHALTAEGNEGPDALSAIVLGPQDFRLLPHYHASPSLIVLDLATEVCADWLQGAPLSCAYAKPGAGIVLTDMLARADYFICASDALRDHWLPYMRLAGRVGESMPGSDVIAVVPDPAQDEALEPVRRFLAQPVRRGIPVHVGGTINVSEASYRHSYRTMQSLLARVGQLSNEVTRLQQLQEAGRLNRIRRWVRRLIG